MNISRKTQSFLDQNTPDKAFDFARWVIKFNIENQNPPHDYKRSLEGMAQGIRKFGGTEGILLVEFIENVTQETNSRTVGEVKDFHALKKEAVSLFNAGYC